MKEEDFWNADFILKDLLFSTSLNVGEIAEEIGVSSEEINRRIKAQGLEWVRKKGRKVSRGQAALTRIVEDIIPRVKIDYEYPVGERLRLDLYLPEYSMGIEYHGRQHFIFSDLFYETKDDFEAAKRRDLRKIELCQEQSIALIIFKYDEKLTEHMVYDRIITALKTSPFEGKMKVSNYKGNPFYERSKVLNREYRKEQYKEMKRRRDNS